jgi:hypothetical protein
MPETILPELKTIAVPARQLYRLLSALKGAPYEIRELMITRGLPCKPGDENPIDALEAAYDEAIEVHAKALREAEIPK